MAKILDIDMEDCESICDVGKALSSPVRIEILKLLYNESLIIGDIARKLDIPASSAAMHIKLLEKANLVRIEEQPGTRGLTKLCNRKSDYVNICLLGKTTAESEIASLEMPIGAFIDCHTAPTCGLIYDDGVIGMEDMESAFYLPERIKAKMLWTSAGYITYRFANTIPKNGTPKRLWLMMEICSEAPNYREDWKSDITVWVNGIDCGTWTCPGDFGARRGRLNPEFWSNGGATQYGLLMTWEVRSDGAYINEKKAANIRMEDLNVMNNSYIDVKIGNKSDAKYVGGFNLFGKGFGDYNQDIILSMEY
ncbi:MAG: helix-turn-helix domain-containing protein [Mobilitalea sp.]